MMQESGIKSICRGRPIEGLTRVKETEFRRKCAGESGGQVVSAVLVLGGYGGVGRSIARLLSLSAALPC